MLINKSFYRTHLFYPLFAFILIAALLEITQLDLIIADWLFTIEGNSWSLRKSFLFSTVLHTGGALVFKVIILSLILFLIATYYVEKIRPYRKPVFYLAIVVPASVALITNIGKLISHVDCPWDLVRYGGEHPYIQIFQSHPGLVPFGKCFPAGHSSIGYSLLALYFFCIEVAPSKRFIGLVIGLAIGGLFGVSQQLRGAHFLSHDVWTLAICWFTSLTWFLIMFRRKV